MPPLLRRALSSVRELSTFTQYPADYNKQQWQKEKLGRYRSRARLAVRQQR
jgi:hypothetical protein